MYTIIDFCLKLFYDTDVFWFKGLRIRRGAVLVAASGGGG
jgi:hypothetical protein